jgi:hypothetical protein
LSGTRTRSRFTLALPLNQTGVLTVTEGVIDLEDSLKSREHAEADDDKQRSHRGNRTTVRLSNGHSLYRQHKSAVGIASGRPQALSLVQPKGLPATMAVAAVAAKDVFCGLQVTELESFPRFFLFHFIFPFRCFGLP